jgi:hypothetical protein
VDILWMRLVTVFKIALLVINITRLQEQVNKLAQLINAEMVQLNLEAIVILIVKVGILWILQVTV